MGQIDINATLASIQTDIAAVNAAIVNYLADPDTQANVDALRDAQDNLNSIRNSTVLTRIFFQRERE